MSSSKPQRIDIRELIDRYSVLLIDAYGVLITHDDVLPGARELITHLAAASKPFLILTNDASRSPERSAERYRGLGLPVTVDQVVTAGSLLTRHFAEHGLVGARCVVLGPADSTQYVRDAGGVAVDLQALDDAEVLVICDERGFDLLPALDRLLTLLCRKIDAGESLHLVVPNPDVIYPVAEDRLGFTAGSLALLFEEALRMRYPEREDLRFVRLGKPHRAIFEEARRRSGTDDMVMLGDQLATDIRGAVTYGIASALVSTGLTRLGKTGEPAGGFPPDARPTFLLDSILPSPTH